LVIEKIGPEPKKNWTGIAIIINTLSASAVN